MGKIYNPIERPEMLVVQLVMIAEAPRGVDTALTLCSLEVETPYGKSTKHQSRDSEFQFTCGMFEDLKIMFTS